jgi:DNA-binding NtrC family response regulator
MNYRDTVLIVDDEQEICVLLATIIRKKNMLPHYVHTVNAAIEAVNDKHPSLLFLDINLPDGNGLELLSELNKKFPSMKIVIISAYDSFKDKAMSSGAYDFLPKPFSKDSVNNILNRMVH